VVAKESPIQYEVSRPGCDHLVSIIHSCLKYIKGSLSKLIQIHYNDVPLFWQLEAEF
jgi:hypothetical protein